MDQKSNKTELKREKERRYLRRRILLILLLCTFLFLLWAGKLFYLQLWRGEALARQAETVRLREEIIPAPRGTIYDRNGNPLVQDIPAFAVFVQADLLQKRGETERALPLLARYLNLSPEEVEARIKKGGFMYLTHSLGVAQGEGLQAELKKQRITAVGLVPTTVRSYVQGSLAAHILGFTGIDQQGLTGIELACEQLLRGEPGRMLIEGDPLARGLILPGNQRIPPQPGKSVVLTIDQTIQLYVEKALDEIMAEHKPARAVIIVLDPATGEILAMGVRPTFEPNAWQKMPPEVWQQNPAIHYNYEPGSTFKIITAAAALEEGVVSAEERFYDPGYTQVLGRKIFCWDRAGHGTETFAEGVQNSCNPVFIQVGLRLGKEKMLRYIKGFGFGRPTGVDLPGESAGLLKAEETINELDLATMSIGQSLAVTPLQLVTAVAAVANDGLLMQPHLIKAVRDEYGRVIEEKKPEAVRQVISPATARQLKRLLEKVVQEGTGTRAFIEGYPSAGKTGTAQVPAPGGGYAAGRYVASFAGFAPVDEPRIAMLIMVAEPGGGHYYGGEVAAPVFGRLAREILQYLQVPADPSYVQVKGKKEQGEGEESSSFSGGSAALTAPHLVKVANFVGLTWEDAQQIAVRCGLKLQKVRGGVVVVEQQPPPGSLLPPGAAVKVYCKSLPPGGAAEIIVPDLTGLTIKEAGQVLQRLGLKLLASGSGLAFKQQPSAGKVVPAGSVVQVEFSYEGE